jgi:hypothetical protein
MKGQNPRQLFREYQLKTEQGLNDYTRFLWVAPLEHVKKLERQFWKDGVLAELYGRVAGLRDGIDYIEHWRTGQ